jgi:hypothetical protein
MRGQKHVKMKQKYYWLMILGVFGLPVVSSQISFEIAAVSFFVAVFVLPVLVAGAIGQWMDAPN